MLSADRRPAGCSGAGRSSSGCCRGRSRTRRSTARPRRPTSATTGTASSPTSPSTGRSCPGSWTARRTSRRGRRWSRTSRRSPSGPASRSATAAAGRRRAARAARTASAFVLETTRRRVPRPIARSSRSASPSRRAATPGIELAAHYADTRPAETYAGKRVFIIGKQNSGFELASGLLQWARRSSLASPSPAKLSVNTKSLVGVRARYVQPFEDHVLGGGVSILDASIGAIERRERRRASVVRPTVRRRRRDARSRPTR